jgi:hypothetical protein
MAGNLRRVRISPQRATNSSWARVQCFRECSVSRYFAGWDLTQEGIDARLEGRYCDFFSGHVEVVIDSFICDGFFSYTGTNFGRRVKGGVSQH